MANQRFKNKIALITGGSSGMGFASAKLLINEGAKVVITGRNKQKLEGAAAELGSDYIFPIQGDVANMDHLDSLVQIIRDKYGKLDILFANAGIGFFKPFLEITEADFNKITNINFKGVFFTIQKMASLMEEGGSIIINASWTQFRGIIPSTLYSSTKAAASNLAQTIAGELAPKGIRVNAINPGYVSTAQFNEKLIGQEEAKKRKKQVALNRFGEADEIAKTVAFLASSDSSYINGENILIDGGLVNIMSN